MVLYHLCGDTMTNHAVVANLGSVLDTVILWHQQLGHMSEKGLKIPYDKGMLFGTKYYNLDLCGHCMFV